MSLITKKRVAATFLVTLIISLVSLAGPLYLSLVMDLSSWQDLIYLIIYGNIYVMGPLLALSLIILVIQNFMQQGIYEAIKEISFYVLIILLSFSVVYYGFEQKNYQSNQVEVVIANRTDRDIRYIKLHGRNALTEIDSLSANSDTTVLFRGKKINYETENDYENEVTLLYYYRSEWREQKILGGFSRWLVLNGPFKLEVFDGDSVKFSYL